MRNIFGNSKIYEGERRRYRSAGRNSHKTNI